MSVLNEEFLNEVFKEFIIEAMQSDIVRGKISVAIKDKRLMKIYYMNESPGERIIEPFAMGINKNGNWCVRAWIHSESLSHSFPHGKNRDSLTWKPGWRMFRIDHIRTANYVKDPDPKVKYKRFDGKRPKYNPRDKDMAPVHSAVKGTHTPYNNSEYED
jgi:hypothetical protein